MMSTTIEIVDAIKCQPGMEYIHNIHTKSLPVGTDNSTSAHSDAAVLMQHVDESTKDSNDAKVERTSATFANNGKRFLTRGKGVQQQYSHIYYARLEMLKESVKQNALKQWGKEAPFVENILALRTGQKACILGTVYKEMKKKPNILRELDEAFVAPSSPRAKFTDDRDTLILEDQAGRISLIGSNLPLNSVVSGVVMACYGIENADGEFYVSSYCFAGMAPQTSRDVVSESAEGDKYIGLVSGLNVGPQNKNLYNIQMMADYLTGSLGNANEQSVASKISHLMVLGDVMGPMPKKAEIQAYVSDKNARNSADEQHFALKELDSILAQIAANTPILMAPGEQDPSNLSLPQLPLHRSLFPTACAYTSWTSLTNPFDVAINGVDIISTSGQTVNDVYKYCDIEDRLEIMENMLNWRHLAPTAPDTLPVYPFHNDDVFVLDKTPHVYLAGNQPDFEERVVKGGSGQEVHIIAVPKFSSTPVLVLLNTRTLQCHPIFFSGPDDDM
eukprot:CFRG4579T1